MADAASSPAAIPPVHVMAELEMEPVVSPPPSPLLNPSSSPIVIEVPLAIPVSPRVLGSSAAPAAPAAAATDDQHKFNSEEQPRVESVVVEPILDAGEEGSQIEVDSRPQLSLPIELVEPELSAAADMTPPLTPTHEEVDHQHYLKSVGIRPPPCRHQYTQTPTHDEIDFAFRGMVEADAHPSASAPETPLPLRLNKSPSFSSRRESVLWSPQADGEGDGSFHEASGSFAVSTPSHSVLGSLEYPFGPVDSPTLHSRAFGGLLPNPQVEQELLRAEIQRNYTWGRVQDLYG